MPKRTLSPLRRAATLGLVGLLVAAPGATAVLIMVADTLASGQVFVESATAPIATPPFSTGVAMPALVVSSVPGRDLYTPSVTGPRCSLELCSEPTELPGASASLPGLPSQTLGLPGAALPEQCAPAGLACVELPALQPTSLGPTPAIEGLQHEVPGGQLPALCSALDGGCPAPVTLAPAYLASVPASPPLTLLPATSVSVSLPGTTLATVDALGEGSVHPDPVDVPLPLVGNVRVRACAEGCPLPAVSGPVSSGGDARVEVGLGGQSLGLGAGLPPLPSI